ncbi:hypothetical protein C2G38_2092579 [Gigaspora rosea]|uniref:Uncharacterized protein n=1 Tax=Gigaspora rosea TaxID=44941 RepID=A0A397V8Y9_9GLOM|nr:hypothetical protein C2G38_2092579 [Gigaspora rosea]
MPIVQEICKEFIEDFRRCDKKMKPKLTHNKTWKESEETTSRVVKEILSVLKNIWNNPAFGPEVARTLNEGMYQSTVIVPLIQVALKTLPVGDSFFISTSEKQSIVSANRKGEKGRRRRPDIMLLGNYLETTFELMNIECTRLFCSPQKKTDDEIKLWREANDGYAKATIQLKNSLVL